MKIFFTCSKSLPEEYREKILKTLEDLNCEIKIRKRLTSYAHVNTKIAKKIVNENIKLIKECDAVVAEVSYKSISIGYHISIALTEKKPVIVLYNFNYDNDFKQLQTTLLGLPFKHLILKEYSIEGLKYLLENSLCEAKEMLHTKFNFLLPPDINKYLEWQVKYKNRSKSEVTREALEEKIKNDKEYLGVIKK